MQELRKLSFFNLTPVVPVVPAGVDRGGGMAYYRFGGPWPESALGTNGGSALLLS